MALQNMQAELRGSVPKLPFPYTTTLINRAWRWIRDKGLWSFQLFEGQWISPPQFLGASCTATQGSNQIPISATDLTNLTALLPTQPYSLITQRQFRIGSSGVYNIWGFNPTTGIFYLDRPYGEQSQPTGVGFTVYQTYYVPIQNSGTIPTYLKDFKSWISVRDMQNFIDLYTDKTRAQIDEMDPQRTWYYFPTDVIAYEQDQNPVSATYGYMMYELWGAPTYTLNYQLMGIRTGLDLVNPTDTLPAAIGEDCVMALARMWAYEWAEANRDLSTRSQGPDFKFLMGAAKKEFDALLQKYRLADRERVDNWYFVRRKSLYGKYFAYFNSQGGTAYPGVAFGS